MTEHNKQLLHKMISNIVLSSVESTFWSAWIHIGKIACASFYLPVNQINIFCDIFVPVMLLYNWLWAATGTYFLCCPFLFLKWKGYFESSGLYPWDLVWTLPLKPRTCSIVMFNEIMRSIILLIMGYSY